MDRIWGAAGFVVLLACPVWGQTGPTFEVAAIKLADPAANGSRTSSSPGRLTMSNMTLRRCILNAYGIQDYQLSGGPGWVNTQGYDIVAKVDEAVEKLKGDERRHGMQAMLQALLADRFQLVLQHDTKVLPAYVLQLAKGGLKLKEVEATGNNSTNTSRGKMTGTRVSMAQMASILSGLVGRPVVDSTGVKGFFEVKLEWTPEEQAAVKAEEGVALDKIAGPSLFTALQEQAGLRLESQKAPVELLVITRAEKPSEN